MRTRLLIACYVAFSALMLYLASTRPIYNWDMIGYAAVVESMDTDDAAVVHQRVFDSLRRYAPPPEFEELVDRNDYRRTVYRDPESLRQHIPFYRTKLAYVGAVYLLTRAGVGVLRAMHLVSAVCAVCGLWLLFFAFRRRVDWLGAALVPVIGLALGALEVARLATPDAMGFAALALFALLFLERPRALLVVVPLFVLVRPDLVLLLAVAYAWMFFTRDPGRPAVVASAVAAAALFLSASWFVAVHRWQLYVSYAGAQPYPLDATVALSVGAYIRTLARGLRHALYSPVFTAYVVVALATVAAALRLRLRPDRDRRLALSTILFAYLVVHTVAHPFLWDRFFAGVYVTGACVLLSLVATARSPGPSTATPAA